MSIASLRFTASDYFFAIFSLFFLSKQRKFRLIRTMPYTLIEIDTDIYVGHITFTYVEFVHMCFFLKVTHTWHCMSQTFKSLFILIPKHSIKVKYLRYFLLCQSNYYLYHAKRWLSHMTDILFQFSVALSTDYVVLLHCHKMTESISSEGQQFHQ